MKTRPYMTRVKTWLKELEGSLRRHRRANLKNKGNSDLIVRQEQSVQKSFFANHRGRSHPGRDTD